MTGRFLCSMCCVSSPINWSIIIFIVAQGSQKVLQDAKIKTVGHSLIKIQTSYNILFSAFCCFQMIHRENPDPRERDTQGCEQKESKALWRLALSASNGKKEETDSQAMRTWLYPGVRKLSWSTFCGIKHNSSGSFPLFPYEHMNYTVLWELLFVTLFSIHLAIFLLRILHSFPRVRKKPQKF